MLFNQLRSLLHNRENELIEWVIPLKILLRYYELIMRLQSLRIFLQSVSYSDLIYSIKYFHTFVFFPTIYKLIKSLFLIFCLFIKSLLNQLYGFGKLHNPMSFLHHFHYDYLLLDIYLDPGTLATYLSCTYLHSLHYIAFCDRVHKNVYFPNKTIEQQNNKIYT